MNPLSSNRLLLAYALGAPIAAGVLFIAAVSAASSIGFAAWLSTAVYIGLAVWVWSEYSAVLVHRLSWVRASLVDVVRLGVPTLVATLALSAALRSLLPDQLIRLPFVQLQHSLNTEPLARAADLVFLVVLAPLLEEWLFRGLLLRSYAQARGGVFALWTTSALFAILHPGPLWFAYTFLMGWMLGRWVLGGGSLRAAFWVHLANNVLAVLLGSNQSSAVTHPLGVGPALVLLAAVLVVAAFFGRRLPLRTQPPERPGPVFSFSLGLVLLLGVFAQAVVLFPKP